MQTGHSNQREREGPDIEAIEAAAAVWLGLRDRGMSPAETVMFMRWLQQDLRHAKIFAELDDTWKGLDCLGRLRPDGGSEPDADLLALCDRPRNRRSWAHAALVAAAAVALFALGHFWLAGSSGDQNVMTAVGAFQKLDLPDGSVVQLNTDSAIEIRFTDAARSVRLVRGEVLFKVAKNPARPFIVTVGQVNVRAVGTAFNVRLRPESVDVLVTEGAVRVDDNTKGESLLPVRSDSGSQHLVAGERATIPVPVAGGPALAVVQPIAPLEVERALAWQERRLEFDAMPLREVVAEFNRYNTHRLIIGDPRLENRRFGGTFRADGYEIFVHLLETNFGVTAEADEHRTILRLAR